MKILKPVIAIVATAAVLFSASTLLAPMAQRNAEADLQEMMCHMLPGSTTFTPEEYTGEDANITAVYKGETGYAVQTTVAGYAGDIVMMVGVDNDGKVTGLKIVDTTGAGDIFGGTAIREVLRASAEPEELEDAELRNIVKLACATASLSATRFGGISSVPSREEVLELIAKQ